MANHDRYEMDILKQLTRIANSLERIETHMPDEKMVELNRKRAEKEILEIHKKFAFVQEPK